MASEMKMTIGKWETSVNPDSLRGYFEHEDFGEGGGLWFQVSDQSTEGETGRKLELIDYDGVFELPKSVIQALETLGFVVSEDFK